MRLTRALLPAALFLVVIAAHAAWTSADPGCDAAGACSDDACAPGPSSTTTYLRTGAFWLGLSYASSAAFAGVALRRAFERRSAASSAGAARGVALSALLPFAGCWLVGCCGSPMLAVYLGLLGASFLPFTGPLVAVLTAAMIAASWAWMRRAESRQRAACAPTPDCGCGDPGKA